MPEIRILYEKAVRDEMHQRADFIEGIVAGVGGCFGGYKEIERVVSDLRR